MFALPLSQGDSELRWMLVGLAVADLIWTAAVVAVGHGALWLLIGLNAGSGALLILVVFRLRARHYSVGGFTWFLAANFGFSVCQVLLLWVPTLLRLGVYNRLAFAVSQLIVVAPLLAAAWLMTRRIDQARP
jgi:hypothetical protein